MDINRIIKTRRAVYPSQFDQGDLNEGVIKELLQNANMAPTHKMTQPWFFKVFKNNGKDVLAKEMVRAMNIGNKIKSTNTLKSRKIIDKCSQSNCIIGIFMKRSEVISIPEWEEIAAVSMAVQNIWLSCVENNIGCYWSTPKYSKEMREFFKLEKNERSLGFMYLGKFDHSILDFKQRKNIEEKIEWII